MKSLFLQKFSIGVWKFIDEASSARDLSANITTLNTPFVPAVPGGSTKVISFVGDKDSYVLLGNTGELVLSSFTWSAMIFPESENRALLTWYLDSQACWYRSKAIWIHSTRLLTFTVCPGVKAKWAKHPTKLVLNQWHEVAVSHNADTGDVQVYLNGNVYKENVGLSAVPDTGPLVMGSRYHYSRPSKPQEDHFKGKVYCMRLWSVARNLRTMLMGTPLCTIN